MIRAIPLLLFFTLVGLFWWGLGQNPSVIPSPLIGTAIPHFEQHRLLSQQQINESAFTKKVTVLNVFASWCMTCQNEHAFLLEIQKEPRVQLIGLNYKDEKPLARQWLAQQGNPFAQIIFDPAAELASKLGVYGTPETFLIDSKGIIRQRYAGPLTQKIWQHQFIPLIIKYARST